MRPEQIAPTLSSSLDDKTDVIHIPVIVIVIVHCGSLNLRFYRFSCSLQERHLPIHAFRVILVTDRVGGDIVRAEVVPRMRILIGNHRAPTGSGKHLRIDRQLGFGYLMEVLDHGDAAGCIEIRIVNR